jgi:starch phosphorylase
MVPLYYKHGKDGLPHDWVKKMKTSMQTLCPIFNTNRMVMEYTEKFYIPGAKQMYKLASGNFEKAKSIAKWKDSLSKKWGNVHIVELTSDIYNDLKVGDSIKVQAVIDPDGMAQEDLLAEIYYGYQRGKKEMENITTVKMVFSGNKDKNIIFEALIKPESSGTVNFTVRLLPYNADLNVKFLPGYIKWSEV